MKKLITAIVLLCVLTVPFSAFADDTPDLTEISFKGAEINEKFSPESREYTLTLENPGVTPTLESYKISGSAKLFVNYNLDAAKHQTGVTVTLEYAGGSSAYTFNYTNAAYDTTSANNKLKDISCPYCEVYPEVSARTTNYKIYIPSDLTVLNITTVTEDINAYCDLPKTISLSPQQEPEFSLTVTAANGDTRAYSLKIKRTDKTTEEVALEIKNNTDSPVINNELIFSNPVFIIAAISAAGGAVILIVLIKLLKRITVKACDADETEFFDI